MKKLVCSLIAVLLAIPSYSLAADNGSKIDFSRRLARRGKVFQRVGTVESFYADDFESQEGHRFHTLTDRRGRRYRLALEGKLDIQTGDRIKVRGRKARGNSTVYVAANGSDENNVTVVSTQGVEAAPALRSLLIVNISSNDGATNCSDSQLANTTWDGSLTIDGLYRESSYDKEGYARDTNGDGLADVEAVTISMNTASACDYNGIRNAANSVLTARGVNLNAYSHRGYVIPSNVNCGWAGLGNLPGNTFWVKGNYCGGNAKDIYIHEIGHNRGMHHANRNGSEYNDRSCIMGYGGIGHRHFNAPHKVQMGWTESGDVVSISSGTQTHTLEALELFANPSDSTPTVLTVATGNGSEKLYISYRKKDVGNYSGQLGSDYDSKINIHTYSGGSSKTDLIATLADGQSYTNSALGLTVRMLSHDDATLTAMVETSFNVTCYTNAPSLSLSPSSQGTNNPGDSLSYTLSITNNDSTYCSASNFSLASSVPAGWTGSFGNASISIAPGNSASTSFTLTSSGSALSGTYGFSVNASSASHSAVSRSGSYVLDATAPSAPTNLTATLQSGRGKKKNAQLSWSGSSDSGSGVSGYTIYRNGSAIGQTSGTSFTDSNIPSGTLDYTVTAYDGAGNESAASNTASLTNGGSTGGGGGKGGGGKGNGKNK